MTLRLLTTVLALAQPAIAQPPALDTFGVDSPGALAAKAYAGELTDDQLRDAVALALRAQQDGERPWVPAWGDVVDHAWRRDLMTRDQKAAYARHSARFTPHLRPTVVRGEPLAAGLEMESRVGRFRQFGLVLKAVLTVAGQPATNVESEHVWCVAHRGSPPPRFLAVIRLSSADPYGPMGQHSPGVLLSPRPAGWTVEAAPGEQPAKLTVEVRIHERAGPDEPMAHPASAVLAEWVETFELPIRVIDPPGDVGVVEDKNERARLEKAIRVKDIGVMRGSMPTQVIGSIVIPSTTVPVAWEMFFRVGTQEWYIADVTAHPKDGGISSGFGGAVGKFDFGAKRVDVILRPSPRAARQTCDIDRILGGEIVLENVPISAR